LQETNVQSASTTKPQGLQRTSFAGKRKPGLEREEPEIVAGREKHDEPDVMTVMAVCQSNLPVR